MCCSVLQYVAVRCKRQRYAEMKMQEKRVVKEGVTRGRGEEGWGDYFFEEALKQLFIIEWGVLIGFLNMRLSMCV